jgi:hypothetical protein
VSCCANPDCRRKLRYLRDGKIYLFARRAATGSKWLEHFWLCGECFKVMTLVCVNQSEVRTVCRGLEAFVQAASEPSINCMQTVA